MSVPEQDYEAILHVPKQKKRVLKDMGASLSVSPPLGQITQVRNATVQVTVLLQVPSDQAAQPWEVAVWHAAGDHEWSETPLSPTDKTPSTLQKVDDSVVRLWFDGHVSVKSLLNFTVKFRPGPDQEWKWIRDEQNMPDGTIILNSDLSTDALPDDFASILKGHDTELKVTSCRSQCPGTKLWAVEANVGAAHGDDSTYKDFNLGLPWGGFLR